MSTFHVKCHRCRILREANENNIDAFDNFCILVFGSPFNELAAAFMTDRQCKQLRKLINFRFTRDRNYNLPAKRLKAPENFLLRWTTFLQK